MNDSKYTSAYLSAADSERPHLDVRLTADRQRHRRGQVHPSPHNKNRDTYVRKNIERRLLNRPLPLEQLRAYFQEHPCVGCGKTALIVLEFNHPDQAEKITEVSALMTSNATWLRGLVEIEKRDVRCANCHKRRTAVQLG